MTNERAKRQALINNGLGRYHIEQRLFDKKSGVWGQWNIITDFETLDKAIQFVKESRNSMRIWDFLEQTLVTI